MDKVSIIVPVYNIDEYIEECLQSIRRQDWQNIEVLLIDDGSKDNSGAICDTFAAADLRIKVIHTENGGLSAALNIGLDYATGEWILFVDGDDIIHSQLVSYCMRLQRETDADIVQFAFLSFKDREMLHDDLKYPNEGNPVIRTISGKEGFSYICLKDNPADYPNLRLTTTIRWSKLYKRTLFENLRYPEGRIHEDEWLIHHIFARAGKMVFSSFVGYFYRIREKSIMQSGISVNCMDKADAFIDRISFLKENDFPQYKRYMVNKCVAYCIQIFCKSRQNPEWEQVNIKNRIDKVLSGLAQESKDFSAKSRISYWGYRYCPVLLSKIFHWHHKQNKVR